MATSQKLSNTVRLISKLDLIAEEWERQLGSAGIGSNLFRHTIMLPVSWLEQMVCLFVICLFPDIINEQLFVSISAFGVLRERTHSRKFG